MQKATCLLITALLLTLPAVVGETVGISTVVSTGLFNSPTKYAFDVISDGTKDNRMIVMALTASNRDGPNLDFVSTPVYGAPSLAVEYLPMLPVAGSEAFIVQFGDWYSRTKFYYALDPVPGNLHVVGDVGQSSGSWAITVFSLYNVSPEPPEVLGKMLYPIDPPTAVSTVNFATTHANTLAISAINIYAGNVTFAPDAGMTKHLENSNTTELGLAFGSKNIVNPGSTFTQWTSIGQSTFLGNQVVIGVHPPGSPPPSSLGIIDSQFGPAAGEQSATFSITVASQTGYTYQLTRSTNDLTNFVNVGPSVIGNGGNLNLIDQSAPDGKAFYKVVEGN